MHILYYSYPKTNSGAFHSFHLGSVVISIYVCPYLYDIHIISCIQCAQNIFSASQTDLRQSATVMHTAWRFKTNRLVRVYPIIMYRTRRSYLNCKTHAVSTYYNCIVLYTHGVRARVRNDRSNSIIGLYTVVRSRDTCIPYTRSIRIGNIMIVISRPYQHGLRSDIFLHAVLIFL